LKFSRKNDGRDDAAEDVRRRDHNHCRGACRSQLECPGGVAGLALFIVAALAWMADGWLEGKASLVIQNVILLAINVLGVWRWLPSEEMS
jgi:hypothetical protein